MKTLLASYDWNNQIHAYSFDFAMTEKAGPIRYNGVDYKYKFDINAKDGQYRVFIAQRFKNA